MKRWLIAVVCALVLPVAIIAQKPVENVSKKKHPNIAAAQRLCEQAFNKISAAQSANEWDMQGHAEKAKHLLDEANQELKQAALAANANRK
jgi:F0F1-type ATP synthase membrane subunit b/b'